MSYPISNYQIAKLCLLPRQRYSYACSCKNRHKSPIVSNFSEPSEGRMETVKVTHRTTGDMKLFEQYKSRKVHYVKKNLSSYHDPNSVSY